MNRGRFIDLIKGVVLAALYYISARLGLEVDAVSGFATLVWLPTGISLAFLLIFGLRFWPAIALAAFLANYSTGAPSLVAIGIGIGNTLEAATGAYLLKRVVKFRAALDRLVDVLGLIILAAIFSTLISATIGVSSLWLGGVISLSAYFDTWVAWWAGDMISNLVIAPFILVWSAHHRITISPRFLLELGGLVLTLGLVALAVFSNLGGVQTPLTYLIFPPLIWAALRFSPRAAITAVFLLSILAVWGTAKGFGPFAKDSVSNSLLYLQSFMGVTAATTMLLAAAVSERKHLERKKDEFISVASHELRTPLTTIKTLAQALQSRFEKLGDKDSSNYLIRIDSQMNKLTRLVLELLDIARIEEGKMILNKEKFNIVQLTQEIIDDFSQTTDQNFTLKGLKNALVTADRDRIAQVLTNLVSNAVKYSSSAKKITIKVTDKSDGVTVSVQDFGTGILIDDQQNIFDRFYQIDAVGSSSGTNLGLGLYIAKEIVDRHGGTIWLESKKGKGSTFYFKLPK